MDKIDKRELALEAVELIKEYGELSIERRGGENPITQTRCSEDGEKIFVEEIYDKEREYSLCKIAKLFECEISFGGLDEDFESLRKAYNIQTKFEKMTKDEFIQYIGNIYYSQLRCKQIYQRLEKICEIAAEN